MNLIEKAIAKRAGLEAVFPGDRVTVNPSIMYLSGENAKSIIQSFREEGYTRVCNPSSVMVLWTDDCRSADEEGNKVIEVFCDENDVRLIEGGKAGNGVSDEDLAMIVGVDNAIDAFCAQGMIPYIVSPIAMAHCLGTGEIEVVIPETVYIEVGGKLNTGTNAQDLCDYLISYFSDSLVGCGVILGGSAIENIGAGNQVRLTRFISESLVSMGIISPKGPIGQVKSVVKIDGHHIAISPYV